jgi:hypothetical protein
MERAGEANRQDATYRLATGGDPAAEAQYRLATGYEPSNVPAPALGGAPALRRPSGQAELAAMEDAERAKQRVNALAPAPAPSVNALAPAPSVNAIAPDAATALQNKIIDLQTRFPNSSKQEVALLTKRLEAMLKESPDLINMERLGYPLTQEGYKLYREAQRTERLLTPEEEAQKVRIGLASRPPAQPAQPQAPVAVVDPVTGKPVYVTREQALSGKMTPANAMEGLTPKDIQKREAAYPKATSALKSFETETNAFDKDIEKLRNHPGLSEITGLIGGRTPALTGAGRQAQALYEKITAKGGFQALQNMRNASPTGGALGNVSNQEGLRLEKSVAAIDRRQDAKDVQSALDTYRSDLQNAKRLMREAYDDTYSYKSGAGGAADPLGIR